MTHGPERLETGPGGADSATFAPAPIGRPHAPLPVVTASWVVGLVALVAVGALGHGPIRTSAPKSVEPLTRAAPHALALPAGEGLGDRTVGRALRVTSPSSVGGLISRPSVIVIGSIASRLDHVVVTLEDASRHVMTAKIVNVSDAGGFRPAVQPSFQASLPIPSPRPDGAMWIVVTAYDAAGSAVDVVERAILITPVTVPALRILDRTDRPA